MVGRAPARDPERAQGVIRAAQPRRRSLGEQRVHKYDVERTLGLRALAEERRVLLHVETRVLRARVGGAAATAMYRLPRAVRCVSLGLARTRTRAPSERGGVH